MPMKRYLILLIAGLSLISFAYCEKETKKTVDISVDHTPVEERSDKQVASYADVLEKATPAVVSVYSTRVVEVGRQRVPEGLPELFREFGFPVPEQRQREQRQRDPRRSPERREQVGVGSGVILSEDGYIVTNHHVVHDRRGNSVDKIRIRLRDDRELEAELVGSDKKTDVAVLKVDVDEKLPVVKVADSKNLRVGDVVFAIGNPLEIGLTATQGIVSATGRSSLGLLGRDAYENFIQTDAAINLGNSGGALIDARGRLVGINTAILSRTGGNIGIGFAIPSNMALSVMKSLIETGEVSRGLLGLYIEDLSPDLAESFGIDTTKGAVVNQVQSDSPAEEAGVKHGDVITYVNDERIESASQLRLTISQKSPGTEVTLTIIREGEEIEAPVELGSAKGSFAESYDGKDVLEGVVLEQLSESIRSELSVPGSVDGVLVREVDPRSPYAAVLRPGIILLELNGSEVTTPEEVAENLRSGVNRFYVWFDGMRRYIVLKRNQ